MQGHPELVSGSLLQMARVKTGTTRRKRHKKVLKRTKGFRMTKGRLYKVSKEADLHAGQYAYIGRRLKKRDLRRLWIQRINAALSPFNLKYSQFIKKLKNREIALDRKNLSFLAREKPEVFEEVVKKATS